jgi:hypothetical protein
MAPKKGSIPWNKGKKLSIEHCENLSSSHMGQTAWNKGVIGAVKHSKKTKKKMSEIHKVIGTGKKLSAWNKEHGIWNKGKKGMYKWSSQQREKWGEWASTKKAQDAFKKQGTQAMVRSANTKDMTEPERAVA